MSGTRAGRGTFTDERLRSFGSRLTVRPLARMTPPGRGALPSASYARTRAPSGSPATSCRRRSGAPRSRCTRSAASPTTWWTCGSASAPAESSALLDGYRRRLDDALAAARTVRCSASCARAVAPSRACPRAAARAARRRRARLCARRATRAGRSSRATARASRAAWARCAPTCSAWTGDGAPRQRALRYARTLGVAMQLTNMLRDVGEDARNGRCYLPDEDLAQFGLTRDRRAARRPGR